jgi:hypothetical protein
MKANYLKTHGEFGKRDTKGIVESLDMYDKLKKGEVDWKDHVKPNLKSITIPAELFFRLMEQDIMLEHEVSSLDKCSFPDGVTIKPDGETELDPCMYVVKEIHKNVTVKVSKCERCGTVDVSWEAQDNTESEFMED